MSWLISVVSILNDNDDDGDDGGGDRQHRVDGNCGASG